MITPETTLQRELNIFCGKQKILCTVNIPLSYLPLTDWDYGLLVLILCIRKIDTCVLLHKYYTYEIAKRDLFSWSGCQGLKPSGGGCDQQNVSLCQRLWHSFQRFFRFSLPLDCSILIVRMCSNVKLSFVLFFSYRFSFQNM